MNLMQQYVASFSICDHTVTVADFGHHLGQYSRAPKTVYTYGFPGPTGRKIVLRLVSGNDSPAVRRAAARVVPRSEVAIREAIAKEQWAKARYHFRDVEEV